MRMMTTMMMMMMMMMMIGGSQPISSDKVKRVTAGRLAKKVSYRGFKNFPIVSFLASNVYSL